jgi:prephenate dehydratase
MKEIDKLIQDYENKLIYIEHSRESDNKVGDHSFYMEYDASKEKINEFIVELKKLQALTTPDVSVCGDAVTIGLFEYMLEYVDKKHQSKCIKN